MEKQIVLSEEEVQLRALLLDVSNHVGQKPPKYPRPQLRFTGGWVRDRLLGLNSKDIDIGIDSMTGYQFGSKINEYLELPEAKAKYANSDSLKLAKIEANPEKSKHLETVATKILGFEIDLVHLRKEKYTDQTRNPQVEPGTPEEDALRRDATINALFYNLDTSVVEDFTGRGLEDMKRKIIKTPLDPCQTFMDDPLRVLRAIRFASRLGWQIDEGDERAMSDITIQKAFYQKISRERVGIELDKMLHESGPHQALHLIDRLGLYSTVFTTLDDKVAQSPKTECWKRAYDQLQVLVSAKLMADVEPPTEQGLENSSEEIGSILLRDPTDFTADVYQAWLLCAFVPWARVAPAAPQNSRYRILPTPAALAARNGIKADNNTVKLVDNAVKALDDIIQLKDAATAGNPSTTSPLKRKHGSPARSEQGMGIRRWGPHWRSSVMFAILTQVMENTEESHNAVLAGYAKWLVHLKDLDLLEANDLKPLVTGDMLSKAFPNVKPGPWMTKALEICMAWQLANPGEQDPDAAISDVKGRKRELGLE